MDAGWECMPAQNAGAGEGCQCPSARGRTGQVTSQRDFLARKAESLYDPVSRSPALEALRTQRAFRK